MDYRLLSEGSTYAIQRRSMQLFWEKRNDPSR